MDTKELLKRVRKIEIKTKGLSNQIFSGEYHSAFKGSGMAFSEVREYAIGDEIRKIDWNVSARLNSTYVKVFDEERELTVMLLVDLSSSGEFGSHNQEKRHLITELCAVLAFSAIQNNDKIGAIFFSDQVEKFIPPKKGRSHILRIIRELIDFKPESKKTNISKALKYLTNIIKKRSIVFVVSDFIDSNFEDSIKITNRKHDVVALQIFDKRENELPNIGIVPIQDSETGDTIWTDTSDAKTRTLFKANRLKQDDDLKNLFRRSGIDYTKIATHLPYVKPLMGLFKKRESRR